MKFRFAMMCAVLVVAQTAMATQYILTRGDASDGLVRVSASVSGGRGEPPKPTVLDTLDLLLLIQAEEGVTLEEVNLRASIGTDFYVASITGPLDVPNVDGAEKYHATLEPLIGGELSIGPIKIVYTTRGLEGDIEHTFELEALHVTIAGAVDLEDGEAPAGLKDRLDAPAGVPWGWVIAGAGVLSIGALAAGLVAMRKKREALPAPPRPAHEVALEALDALEGAGWLERGQVEAFLAACSDILRRYIGARFGIDAPDRTTEEFLQEATHSRHMKVGHVTLLEGFLTKIDLVKFAKRPATADEGREAAAQARAFIEETALREDAAQGAAEVGA